MKGYAPPSKWRCRSCGKDIDYNQVHFVGAGIPVCRECHDKWQKEKERKPCPKK